MRRDHGLVSTRKVYIPIVKPIQGRHDCLQPTIGSINAVEVGGSQWAHQRGPAYIQTRSSLRQELEKERPATGDRRGRQNDTKMFVQSEMFGRELLAMDEVHRKMDCSWT